MSLPVPPLPPSDPSLEGILSARPALGANCSSVGSVIDMLFVSGVVGGALLVAVSAALDEASRSRGAVGRDAGDERDGGAGAGDADAD